MATMTKVCHICAMDVSQKKRTKDSQGRYYCESCYKAQAARAGSGGAAVATAEPPKKPAPIPVDDDDGLIGLADDVKKAATPEKPESMFGCADCKRIVPEKQIRNDDGDFVCFACFARRRQKTPSAMARKRPLAETEEAADENRERWTDTLVGGGVISAGVVVLSFAIYLMLHLYVPPVGKHAVAPTAPFAMLLAGVETVFVVFKAAALLVSMIFAARLLGGIDFGYIGSALWKSLALVLAFGVLSFFSDRFEAIWMLSYGFKWGALILAFVVVFKIDFFEAMILSFVNFIIFFALAIAMAGLILSLNRSFSGDHGFPDDGDAPIEHAAPDIGG